MAVAEPGKAKSKAKPKLKPAKASLDAMAAFGQRLGHDFANPQLLSQALTHRSFGADHNERLEYLGDAVLSLVISERLFHAMDTLPEGEMSRARAHLVQQSSLHERALQLGIPQVLKLGEGEKKTGGQQRPSMLADAFEAVMGAIYLDAGYEAVRAVILRLFEGTELRPEVKAATKDAKTALQEWMQARKHALPHYRIVAITGAAHAQTFDVECEVPALNLSRRGIGSSRRSAEQSAAAAVLEALPGDPS
jgi:ribonuclease-3